MQNENSNRNLPKTLIVLCKLKTVTETCPKINCIMQTKNSNRNLCQKYIVLCKLKTVRETCVIKMQTEIVTETCLKHILYYAN